MSAPTQATSTALSTMTQLGVTFPTLLGPYWRERAVSGTAAWLLARYHRPAVEGLAELPRDRPLIYVAKHPQSCLFGETILLAAAVEQEGLVPFRRFDPGPGAEVQRSPLLWPSPLGPSPHREALAALRAGQSMLLFPGGARERLGPADVLQWRSRRSYARLALLTGTPVVPVAIEGADRQHLVRLRLEGGRAAFLPPIPLPVKLTFRFGRAMAPPARGDTLALSAYAEEVAHAARLLLAGVRERRRRR